jgi:hypothetical protein
VTVIDSHTGLGTAGRNVLPGRLEGTEERCGSWHMKSSRKMK